MRLSEIPTAAPSRPGGATAGLADKSINRKEKKNVSVSHFISRKQKHTSLVRVALWGEGEGIILAYEN